MSTITDPKEITGLLRAIKGYRSSIVTRCALRLAPLVFVRPGELRQAEWREINLETEEWRIPAEKMKAGVLQEFDEWFTSESSCIDFIQRLRWPDGFKCPVCGVCKGWLMNTGLIRCAVCQHKVSVIAGTIFHGTRKPLKLWFQAMWL